jgi:hypothetical protein
MFNRNNQARIERNQQKVDAGFVSRHFPDVSSIVINIVYKQRGAQSMIRTLNYAPDSYAFFKVTCLSDDCVDGGFNLTQVVTSMIRSHSEKSKGELGCDDSGPRPDHAHIAYEIAIRYAGIAGAA